MKETKKNLSYFWRVFIIFCWFTCRTVSLLWWIIAPASSTGITAGMTFPLAPDDVVETAFLLGRILESRLADLVLGKECCWTCSSYCRTYNFLCIFNVKRKPVDFFFFFWFLSSVILFRIPSKGFPRRRIVSWRPAVIGPLIHETDVAISTGKLRIRRGILGWNCGDCVTKQDKGSDLEQRLYTSTGKKQRVKHSRDTKLFKFNPRYRCEWQMILIFTYNQSISMKKNKIPRTGIEAQSVNWHFKFQCCVKITKDRGAAQQRNRLCKMVMFATVHSVLLWSFPA